ncbi:dirigent protein 2-like [Coffea arabica]|uniref:Dirigent protein n=1 Tax=Coffea arabica TaxID=13443 RepID=A0A6P6SB29_COFAR|nr:dirigent protein 2-like [Coffea arabica]
MAKSLAIASLQILSVLLLASLAQSRTSVTHLTVYEHEVRSGAGQSAFLVAGLRNVTWSFSQFGSVYVADNILTQSASIKSQLVGRLQGIGAVVSLDGTTIQVLASIHFTTGEYSGSTVELKGISSADVNQTAIVGGTNRFVYATGYTTVQPVTVAPDLVVARWDLYIRQDIPEDFADTAAR